MEKSHKKIGVIGAGIVGVSTAIWLQRAGHDVTLIDKVGPGAGASFGNGGVLAACACVPVTVPGIIKKAPAMLLDKNAPLFLKWGYLPKLLPWLVKYLGHANETDVNRIAKAVSGVTGDTLHEHQALAQNSKAARWIVPCDYLYLYEDRAAFNADKFGWDIRKKMGFSWEELDGPAVREFDDTFSDSLKFAVKMGEHGRIADPGKYIADLAELLKSQGGTVLKAEVKGFRFEGSRIAAVQTIGGDMAFDEVAVTAGVWSGPLAKALGVDVPLESERGYHIELWEPNTMPKVPVMHAAGKFVITPMEGRIRLAGIVEFGGLDAPASEAPFELLLRNAKIAMPELTWKSAEKWMGHRPAPTDSIPIIGRSPKIENAWMGFGHHHIGLTAGPKSGRLLAEMIGGVKSNSDLASYAPMRFDAK
jgi:D-amino-acid dehydrogenase